MKLIYQSRSILIAFQTSVFNRLHELKMVVNRHPFVTKRLELGKVLRCFVRLRKLPEFQEYQDSGKFAAWFEISETHPFQAKTKHQNISSLRWREDKQQVHLVAWIPQKHGTLPQTSKDSNFRGHGKFRGNLRIMELGESWKFGILPHRELLRVTSSSRLLDK